MSTLLVAEYISDVISGSTRRLLMLRSWTPSGRFEWRAWQTYGTMWSTGGPPSSNGGTLGAAAPAALSYAATKEKTRKYKNVHDIKTRTNGRGCQRQSGSSVSHFTAFSVLRSAF